MSDKLAPRAPLPPRQLVARIVDEPALVAAVRQLDARALGRLVAHVGLEDAGELVALATTEQLTALFDEDLWTASPGRDETFDAERFLLWLEVMLDVGEPFAADKVRELPEELVTMALGRQLLVIDFDRLAEELGDAGDDEAKPVEKALESALSIEIDQWRIIAVAHDGWDTLTALLLALDERDPDYLRRLLERLANAADAQRDEAGGWYEVLTAAEMIESDAAAEREARRARAGYVSPSQASAFLKLAQMTPVEELLQAPRDPVTRAYFREYEPPKNDAPPPSALGELFGDAGVALPKLPLLTDGDDARGSDYARALAALDDETRAARLAELGYLANVLIAAGDGAGRKLRLAEAAERALDICRRGGEKLAQSSTWEAVAREPADRLFRIGWKLRE